MSSLYELKNEYLALKEMMEDESIDETIINDTMEGIEYELEVKADNYIKVIKDFEGQIGAIENELIRLKDKRQHLIDNIEKLKTNLKEAMVETGKTKINTDLFAISVQKNGGLTPIVMDKDIDDIPEKYIKKVELRHCDKEAIREDLEKGIDLDFAHLGEKGNWLRIR